MLTKETTAEFAAGDIHAATANPVDVTRFAGSSSAGSGAAVADYQCHMALGTQTVSRLCCRELTYRQLRS
jgi:Asp-tRNA(Asn)/Glu-tRNA(Gln) amidotransferase A subunit family amidase